MSNLTSGVSGSSGQGTTGVSGTTGLGVVGFGIEEIVKKYNRFTIKIEYDEMTFAPICQIIDNITGEKYTFKPNSITDMSDEIEKFIQKLITDIRQDKINDIINE